MSLERNAQTDVRRLGGQSLVYAASSVVGQLGALLTFPLYTRALGVEAYGVLALGLSAAGVMRTFVIAGTNTALMHELVSARTDERRTITGAAFANVLVGSAIMWGIVLAFLPVVNVASAAQSGPVLLATLMVFIATDSLLELVLAIARAETRPLEYAYSNAIRVGSTLAASSFLLLVVGMGPAGAIAGMTIGSGGAGIWLALRLRVRPGLRGIGAWMPRLLRQGGPLVPANLASWVSNLADRYLLLWLLGSTATVGLYSAGYRVGGLVTTLFVGPFHTAFLPLMLGRLDSEDGRSTYEDSSRLFLVLGSVVVLLLQASAVPVVRLLAGEAYVSSAVIVGPVALGCLLSGVTMLMTPSALKSGRSINLALAFGSGAVANVLLNVLLIPVWGMVGAAVATLLGYGLTLLVMIRLMPAEHRPPRLRSTLARALPVVSTATLASVIELPTPLLQMVGSAALAGAGLVALAGAGVLRRADIVLVAQALSSLLKGAADRLLPRSTPLGRGLRDAARFLRRLPAAARGLWRSWIRRRRRRHQRVAGQCRQSRYLEFLLENPVAFDRATVGAEDLIAGKMMTFGHPWSWGSDRDWHLDPISGRRWRRLPAAALDVNRVVGDSDVQCVWETSRLEHVWRVALAYTRFSDEGYARWAVEQLRSWRRANPLGWGVNWTVAMEVAMRGVAICEIRTLLCHSETWTEQMDAFVCDMLADDVEWILDNLEWRGDKTQNHYLASLVGVMTIASQLEEWTELQDKVAGTYTEFFDCVREQVLEDGVSFENSVGYHLLVCELIAYGVSVCDVVGVQVPEDVLDRLAGMVSFGHAMQFGDGSPVAFGDDDDDFLLPGTMEHYSVAHLHSSRRIEYAAWQLERHGVAHTVRPPQASLAFPRGGIFILGGGDFRTFINAMPTGVCGSGPHRHNDALSFCLEVGGRPALVDSGTFRYQSSRDARNRYRSVRAHTTVQVDGAEQNDLTRLFALPDDRINPEVVRADLSAVDQRVDVSHRGYVKPSGVLHRRAWRYLAQESRLLVVDSFRQEAYSESGSHDFVARFHFGSEITVDHVIQREDDAYEIDCGAFWMIVALDGAQIDRCEVVPTMHSSRYRIEVPSIMLEVSWTGSADTSLETVFTSTEQAD